MTAGMSAGASSVPVCPETAAPGPVVMTMAKVRTAKVRMAKVGTAKSNVLMAVEVDKLVEADEPAVRGVQIVAVAHEASA